jgi:hypothetical protein
VKASTKTTWDYPEGMTFGELRALVLQSDAVDAEAKVVVRVKLGGQIKSLTVASPRG